MKIKLLGLSLVSTIALVGCGNSNNYNTNLPKGGEVIDLKVEKNRKDLMENINAGVSAMSGALLSKGISVKSEMVLDGKYIDYRNDVEKETLTVSGLKANANLDVKGNLTKLNKKGVEMLKGLEMVTSFSISGNAEYSDMVKVKTEKEDSSTETKREKVTTNIKFDKLGAKTELTDGTFYFDLSDGSLLKNGLNNYDSIAKLAGEFGETPLPTKEEFSKLLDLKEGQTFDQYVIGEWNKSGYNKLSISVDELALLAKDEDEDEDEGNISPVKLELLNAEEVEEGEEMEEEAEEEEEEEEPKSLIERIEDILGMIASVDGVLEYRVYKNKTSALKITFDKQKYMVLSEMNEYYDNYGKLEGFKLAEDYAKNYEGLENFEFAATALMDKEYRFTSFTTVINAKNMSYDRYFNEENKVTKVEKESYIEIQGKAKVTANYDGMKKTPAKEHKDYVPVMEIVGGVMKLLDPSSSGTEEVK